MYCKLVKVVIEHDPFTFHSAGEVPRKLWLIPDLTENLLAGSFSHNQQATTWFSDIPMRFIGLKGFLSLISVTLLESFIYRNLR